MGGLRRLLANKERIRALEAWRYYRRRILGHGTRKIAELLGCSRGTVERWESSESDELPDLGDILALAKAMKIDPQELFAWILRADSMVDYHKNRR